MAIATSPQLLRAMDAAKESDNEPLPGAEEDLRAATEARAPPANELNSSDGGHSDDSEAETNEDYALAPGAWVMLRGLLAKPALDGSMGFALERTRGNTGEERWLCQLMPSCDELKVKPVNVAVLAPAEWGSGSKPERAAAEHAATIMIEHYISSGAEALVLPMVLKEQSRNVLHAVAEDHRLDHRSTGPKHARQLVLKTKDEPLLALPHPRIDRAYENLALIHFDELCKLLEAMESVPDMDSIGAPVRGAIETRKRMSERFWRGTEPSSARPRHERPGLFHVVRLLMPHHDSRRYGVSVPKIAAWTAEALGMGSASAKRFGTEWMLDESVAKSETGDVSLVLEALARARISPDRKPSLTVGVVNEALDGMQLRGKQELLRGVVYQCTPREVKWLVRVLLRDLKIGARPQQPVPHKGEYPKILMDGLDRAQGRVGRPSDRSVGSPPLMYTMLRYQNSLEHVCEAAERHALPSAYPPPTRLGIHIRAQLSVPCGPSLDGASAQLGTSDAFVETKYDGFRFQLHWDGSSRTMRCFYRSGVECTADVGDLLPAVRLSLGGDPDEVLCRASTDEPTRRRYSWLEKAWARVTKEQREAFTPVSDVVLDGELLVYDETPTPAGIYDELGSAAGIAAFGTNHWVRQTTEGKPSSYSREDARRHYLFQVFDVLRFNGEESLRRPLHERRELLEAGRCFIALPHYMQLTWALRVDLSSPERPLHALFAAAQAAGEEGLMIKAADRPYVPNARSNVLKCKVEFIEGLGDTVTLLLLGARQPHRLGTGGGAHVLVEFAIGAREHDEAGAPIVWLFNTSPLPWHDIIAQPILERLWRRLTEDVGLTHGSALMQPLRADEHPPSWMRHCPTSAMARPHWVLLEPESAPLVEVTGSRFLRRFSQDTDASSNRTIPWTLRFPRVSKWCEASDGVVADTVSSFRAKAVDAFRSRAPRGDEGDEVQQPASAALVPLKALTWQPATRKAESHWWQAERRDDAPAAAAAAASSSMPPVRSPVGAAAKRSGFPGSEPQKQRRSKAARAKPTQDWDTGESEDEMRRRGMK